MQQDVAASTFLILLSCIAAAYAGFAMFGPSRYSIWERVLYAPVYSLSRVLWRVELVWIDRDNQGVAIGTIDRDRLLGDRMRGGGILIANHRCSLDPFFVQLIGGRRVHWMVASEYFHVPVIGPMLRAFEAIPTNRAGMDTAATRRAITLARSGRFIGMFPEGRINRTGDPLLTIRPGAAIIAHKAGVPLIPIWIEGAPQGPEVYSVLFIPAKVTIYVGAPDDTRLALTNSTSIHDDQNINLVDANDDRRIDRENATQWVREVMGAALSFGGHSQDAVQFAGKNWVNE